jgi:heat shock protein HslJ
MTAKEGMDMHRILLVLLAGWVAAGCAVGSSSIQPTRSTDPQTILGKTWQWESTITPVEKITVPAPERYTIFLQADGRAQMRFDCNRGGGGFKISPGKLSFGPMMSTRMACSPDSLDSAFMRDLQRVVSFFVDNGTLYLELLYDSGTMKFRPEG